MLWTAQRHCRRGARDDDALAEATAAACWAHVLRKFYDLKEAHKTPIATEAVECPAPLYGIDEEIRGRSPDEHREVRDARSRPLLASMYEGLEASLAKLSKKSDTSAAIRYALARWDTLIRFCDDARYASSAMLDFFRTNIVTTSSTSILTGGIKTAL